MNDTTLDEKYRKLVSRHKLEKTKQSQSASNVLLDKYDTISVLAMRARRKQQRAASANELPVLSDEEPLTVISPKRGKMRPQSAPSKRAPQRKQETNQGGYYNADVPYDVTAINPDLWWDEICQKNTKFHPPHQTTQEPRMSRDELTQHLRQSRQQKPRKTSSKELLKEHATRQAMREKEIADRILQEANLMEAKCYAAVAEANNYSKALNRKTVYAIYSHTVADFMHSQKYNKSPIDVANTTIHGAAGRLARMMVEITDTPGAPTRLVTIDTFYKEFDKLFEQVQRSMSIQPSGRVKKEAKKKSTRRSCVIESVTEVKKEAEVDTTKLSREETQNHLRSILASTAEVTRALELQLQELQLRGWNDNIA